MSSSFKNVTPTGPGGTATLLIVLSFTGFLLLTQSLFVVPSGQVAVVTTLGKVSGGSRRAGLNVKIPFVTICLIQYTELHKNFCEVCIISLHCFVEAKFSKVATTKILRKDCCQNDRDKVNAI